MIDSKLFQMMLNTAHTYSEIIHNIKGVQGHTKTGDQLCELLAEIVNELHTNCKGQVV